VIEIDEILTLEEYKALGESIKVVNKNLKLIKKLIDLKGISVSSDYFEEPMVDILGELACDLTNLASDLERSMDNMYPDNIMETNDFFN
jgi:hypothetical protein